MVRPLPKHRARDYETIFIVHPDTQVNMIEQIAGRVTDAIERLEGKLMRAENWGKRRLAYPVRKQTQGYYIYLRYLGYSDLVHEIERQLRMIEPIVKYLTVKIDEDVDPAARPVTEGDISFVPQQIEEETAVASGSNDGAEKATEAKKAEGDDAEKATGTKKAEKTEGGDAEKAEKAEGGDAEKAEKAEGGDAEKAEKAEGGDAEKAAGTGETEKAASDDAAKESSEKEGSDDASNDDAAGKAGEKDDSDSPEKAEEEKEK